jgi:mannose-6-phosphate isomerase class I
MVDAPPDSAFAAAVRRREPAALAELTAAALLPARELLVPRPWGGDAIARHKRITAASARPIGESFELSAAPSDPESRAWPTTVALPDGGILPLTTVLHACPEILGVAHVEAWGHQLPLMPKLLDVAGLLSVQAHPAGHPEAYVVIDAEPGATLQLGLRRDLDAAKLVAELGAAQELQRELARFVGDDLALAEAISAWLLGDDDTRPPELAARTEGVADVLARLRDASSRLLDAMHTVEVRPGMIVHNCVPDSRSGIASATLHALGNRARKRVLALEVRLAGPTLRAWDHGRLPMRALDIAAALAETSTAATDPASFVVAEHDQDCELDNGVFALARTRVGTEPTAIDGGRAQLVHALAGELTIIGPSGRERTVPTGHSALVPACWPHWHARSTVGSATVLRAHVVERPTRLGTCTRSFARLRELVADDHGPREVLVIANGGDGEVVGERLRARTHELFRASGDTRVVVHEETVRRGQLLGSLDAIAAWRASAGTQEHDGVVLGIMLPGQGTRLSPLTQRLHGIKPFAPMPLRPHDEAAWLDAGSASLYSWTLVTRELERMGFRGIAWKWGDEPQLAARALDRLQLDLRAVDAVRFGIEVEITDELARHKEWLLCDANDRLLVQLRRRPEPALRARLAQAGAGARALVHIGSPALSWPFVAALTAELGDWPGALDVDGYLFEALTHDEAAWQSELARDEGLRVFLRERPDFRSKVAAVRARLEDHRGAALAIAVVDFGAGAWWGDMGQLSRAREAFAALAEHGDDGELARRLAGIAQVVPDRFGNRVVGSCSHIPDDGSVTDTVVVDSWIGGGRCDRAVVIGSQLGHATLAPGSVVVDSTLASLTAETNALVMMATGERLHARASTVHTTIPAEPAQPSLALQPWWFDARLDPGSAEHYRQPFADNPTSFADKAAQMRQRTVAPAAIEAVLLERRAELAASFGVPPEAARGRR